jgi:hypothetical protein
MERRLIEATLEHFSGHRARTAKALGIGIRTLSGKLRQYGCMDTPPVKNRLLRRQLSEHSKSVRDRQNLPHANAQKLPHWGLRA